MTDEDLKKIRNLVQEELEPIRKTLDNHTQKLENQDRKLDALIGDVIDLQDQTKAIWDKISLDYDKNKREIDTIKEHTGMPIT